MSGYVGDEDKAAMAKILAAFNGTPVPKNSSKSKNITEGAEVELAGPGIATDRDKQAMKNILSKLNNLTEDVAHDIGNDRISDIESRDSVVTERNSKGVKIGEYQIQICEDNARLAGKQFYQIYNTRSKAIIANDISLYETALGVVRLLNSGNYANSKDVRALFEADDQYTTHRVDAIMFKRKVNKFKKLNESRQKDIYESRCQASLDKSMAAKAQIKKLTSI